MILDLAQQLHKMKTYSKIYLQNIQNTRNEVNNGRKENVSEDKVVEIDQLTSDYKNVPETSVFGFPRPNQVTLVYYQKSYPYKAVALDYQPIKNHFLSFVFALLFLMLIFTAATNIGALILKNSNILSDSNRNIIWEYRLYVLISAIILLIVANFAMNYMAETRTMPGNLVGLATAIVCVSTITCYVTVWYNTQIIPFVLVVTAVTVLMCIPLSFSKFNFKSWLMFPFVITIASVTLVGLHMYSLPDELLTLLERWIPQLQYPPINIYILFACTLGYVIVLVLDLQLILGGNAVELADTDFSLGLFLLYIAFADIFVKTSQITRCLEGL